MPRLNNEWWLPQPLTEDQMKQEIAFSLIKGPASSEFTPETISKTLEALNLTDKNNVRLE